MKMPNDLTVSLPAGKLNIRVAAWLEHEGQLLVSRFPNGRLSLPGGRLKFNENSAAGLKREIFEELQQPVSDLSLMAIVENFFDIEDDSFHELLFIYHGSVPYQKQYCSTEPQEQTILWLPLKQIELLRPAVLQELAEYQGAEVLHLINRDNEEN